MEMLACASRVIVCIAGMQMLVSILKLDILITFGLRLVMHSGAMRVNILSEGSGVVSYAIVNFTLSC